MSQQTKTGIVSAGEFIKRYPEPSPFVIDGLIRQCEVANMIGSTKQGKSWMLLGMGLSIAAGRHWMGREVQQGPVLFIDNELEARTLSQRMQLVSEAMNIPADIMDNYVFLRSLRIDQLGLGEVRFEIQDFPVPPIFVGLDCYYRFQGSSSELDIAAATNTYNQAIGLAHQLGAAVVFNHHSTKGDQSQKSVTDVGSGTGAISRAVDTHMVFRAHELESCAVMEAACRSFKSPDPLTIQWKFPLWVPKDAIAPDVKQQQSRGEHKQARKDSEAESDILTALETTGKWMTVNAVAKTPPVGFAREKVLRTLNRMAKDGKVRSKQLDGYWKYRRNKIDPANNGKF